MNDCLTTPQDKNKSAIGCQLIGIYIKSKSKGYKQCKDLCIFLYNYKYVN